MGSDDLFHKNTVTRRKQAKEERPRILIVCEDEKSSRFYLLGLVEELPSSTVVIIHGNSDPSTILKTARDRYTASQRGDAYDRVYCVFDRDSHVTFDNTCQELRRYHANGYKNKKANITIPSGVFFPAITTTPCYEFWLLLHFTYSTKLYHSTGAQSPCDMANADLKQHHQYDKANKNIYQNIKDKLPGAIYRAKQLATDNQRTQNTNPHTNFHELVEYLQSITSS